MGVTNNRRGATRILRREARRRADFRRRYLAVVRGAMLCVKLAS
jgi:hypothetical protein